MQSSFWAGEHFGCLAEAQVAAEVWCRGRAGLREHGTTRTQPVVVFEELEAPRLLPAPPAVTTCRSISERRSIPIVTSRSRRPSNSIPGELIGETVECVTRRHGAGEGLSIGASSSSVMPASLRGRARRTRMTFHAELTGSAMRDIASQKTKAARRGPAIGRFVEAVLDRAIAMDSDETRLSTVPGRGSLRQRPRRTGV